MVCKTFRPEMSLFGHAWKIIPKRKINNTAVPLNTRGSIPQQVLRSNKQPYTTTSRPSILRV